MASGLFGLKLFRESVSQYTRARNKDDTGDVDASIPNEQSLLEARKFLDEAGITKKLNNYKKIANVLGAKLKVDAKTGVLTNDGSPDGFAKQSAEFYVNINNRSLDESARYLKTVNEMLAAGYTYEAAKKEARDQYKKILDNYITVQENENATASFFDEVKNKFKRHL